MRSHLSKAIGTLLVLAGCSSDTVVTGSGESSSESGDDAADTESLSDHHCTFPMDAPCCFGTADLDNAEFPAVLDEVHAWPEWSVVCQLASPCPMLDVQYGSYDEQTFICIATALRDQTPGHYIITSIDEGGDSGTITRGSSFEVLPGGAVLRVELVRYDKFPVSTLIWESRVLPDPSAFEPCLGMPVGEPDCIDAAFNVPVADCAPLDESSC